MPLTNEGLKKLRRFKTASFAVWPDPIKNLRAIHSRIVILGLNPSAKIKFGENFHGGRFDSWYEKGFSRTPFKGAYMTDLISRHEANASRIVKKWNKDAGFRKRNIENLRKQFKILGVRKSTPILCIGQNTNRLFSSAFPEYIIFPIKHPRWYQYQENGRNVFLKKLKRIRKNV